MVGDWMPEKCSATCGGGTQLWTREITQDQYFGAPCPVLQKMEPCEQDPCPIDCVYEPDWSEWGECSNECGGGLKQKSRAIKVRDEFNGEPCGATQASMTCNEGACDVDCKLSEWTQWTECSKMCGGGLQTRTKLVLEEAQGDGICTDIHETEAVEVGTGNGARWEQKGCNGEPCLPNLGCKSKIDIIMVLD